MRDPPPGHRLDHGRDPAVRPDYQSRYDVRPSISLDRQVSLLPISGVHVDRDFLSLVHQKLEEFEHSDISSRDFRERQEDDYGNVNAALIQQTVSTFGRMPASFERESVIVKSKDNYSRDSFWCKKDGDRKRTETKDDQHKSLWKNSERKRSHNRSFSDRGHEKVPRVETKEKTISPDDARHKITGCMKDVREKLSRKKLDIGTTPQTSTKNNLNSIAKLKNRTPESLSTISTKVSEFAMFSSSDRKRFHDVSLSDEDISKEFHDKFGSQRPTCGDKKFAIHTRDENENLLVPSVSVEGCKDLRNEPTKVTKLYGETTDITHAAQNRKKRNTQNDDDRKFLEELKNKISTSKTFVSPESLTLVTSKFSGTSQASGGLGTKSDFNQAPGVNVSSDGQNSAKRNLEEGGTGGQARSVSGRGVLLYDDMLALADLEDGETF